MSTTRRAPKKKDDIFSKKVPENPRYKHIKPTVDTGSSITKYMERLEEIKKNYKYRPDEIFKRIKVTTFAQLVLQVADCISLEQERDNLSTAAESMSFSGECGTPPYEERRDETADENVPPLNLPKEEPARQKTSSSVGADTARSTLQDLIHGVGEVDLRAQDKIHDQNAELVSSRSSQAPVAMPDVESLPYLLLDVRIPDDFKRCHIIGAINYPKAKLAEYNYLTPELKSFKDKPGKIIIVYDEDERIAPLVASTFVQRRVENIFMLSGGMKVINKRFPEGFITGTLPTSCMPSPPPTRKASKKPPPTFLTSEGQHWEFFTSHHLQKIQDRLNEELLKQENSSRMSSRVSSRSSVTSTSSRVSTSSSSSKKPAWK